MSDLSSDPCNEFWHIEFEADALAALAALAQILNISHQR